MEPSLMSTWVIDTPENYMSSGPYWTNRDTWEDTIGS